MPDLNHNSGEYIKFLHFIIYRLMVLKSICAHPFKNLMKGLDTLKEKVHRKFVLPMVPEYCEVSQCIL